MSLDKLLAERQSRLFCSAAAATTAGTDGAGTYLGPLGRRRHMAILNALHFLLIMHVHRMKRLTVVCACAAAASSTARADPGAPRSAWAPEPPAQGGAGQVCLQGAGWQVVPTDGRGSGFFETVEAESACDPQLLMRLQETLQKFGAQLLLDLHAVVLYPTPFHPPPRGLSSVASFETVKAQSVSTPQLLIRLQKDAADVWCSPACVPIVILC